MQTRVSRLITTAILLLASTLLSAQDVSDEFLKTYRAYDSAFRQGNMERAAELARKALRLAREELGGNHEKIPVLMINLGHATLLAGNLDEAEKLLTEAEKLINPEQAGARANLITIHQDLAQVFAARKEFAAARTELDKAIDLRTQESGADDPQIAEFLNMKARLDITENRFDSADRLLNEGMKIIESNFGENDNRVVGFLTMLGDLAVMRNDLARAESLYLRAMEILRNNLLEDDPGVLAMHHKLANLYIAMDSDKFAEHADTYIASADLEEGSALPLFIVKPAMPAAANTNSGWVLLEMTVTENGRVRDPKVIESSPSGLLDKVAITAARKWRFKPKIQKGERLTQPNTRARIVFQGDRVRVHLGEMS